MKMRTSYSPLSPRINSVSPWAFWALGLLNNSSFVIMVASAKSISEGGTALVFLSNSLPSLIVKLSAPYWFDRVSYDKRMMVACALMIAAFGIVACFATVHHSTLSLYMQLLGCAFVSIQCGMGEASLLALAGKSDIGREKNACLTAFSSGTGLAGVFGFMWNFVWIDWFGLPLNFTLYLGNVLVIFYFGIYYNCVRESRSVAVIPVNPCSGLHGGAFTADSSEPDTSHDLADVDCSDGSVTEEFKDEEDAPSVATREDMTALRRLVAVLRLWPYMIPLLVVYAAEYSLQAGTWTAIGFPVNDEAARGQFYEYSNWMVGSTRIECILSCHPVATTNMLTL
jgi:battenin